MKLQEWLEQNQPSDKMCWRDSFWDQNPLRFYRCDNCGRRFDEPKWVR